MAIVMSMATVSSGVPAPRAAATDCPRNTAADRAWIRLAYVRLIGKTGTEAWVDTWATRLADATSYTDMVDTFANHDVRVRYEIGLLFTHYLKRNPTAAELSGWVTAERAASLPVVAARIVGSPEYYALHGSTTTSFVKALYIDVLHRAVAPTDVSSWVAELHTGASRAHVAQAFMGTLEARRIEATRLFTKTMGRAPTANEQTLTAARIAQVGPLDASADWAVTNEFYGAAQRAAGLPVTALPGQCVLPQRWEPPVGAVTSTLHNYPSSAHRLIALTFDDGPDKYTNQELDILAEEHVPATFFLVGQQVQEFPDVVRRIKAEGHALASHTMTHPQLTKLSEAQQRSEISGAVTVIDAIAGPHAVRCLRPPYGSYNQTTVDVARSLNLAVILWSRDSGDWKGYDTSQIVAGSVSTLYDGGRGIVVFHGHANTVRALPTVIDTLKAQGYQFVNFC